MESSPFHHNMAEKHFTSQNGSVLLEAVVALGVIVIIMTAMAIIVTASLANATFIKNQNQANKYAQEGINLVRMLRDSDYNSFYVNYIQGLQSPDNPEGTPVYQECFNNNYDLTNTNCPLDDPVINQGFRRFVYITRKCGPNYDSNSFQIEVKVEWSGGKCANTDATRFCHKADLISCLSAKQNQSSL